MEESTDPEPDPGPCKLQVGQDEAGHWLVQESGGRMEGRFISFATAMAFARRELYAFPGATIVHATTLLVPIVPFLAPRPSERAIQRKGVA